MLICNACHIGITKRVFKYFLICTIQATIDTFINEWSLLKGSIIAIDLVVHMMVAYLIAKSFMDKYVMVVCGCCWHLLSLVGGPGGSLGQNLMNFYPACADGAARAVVTHPMACTVFCPGASAGSAAGVGAIAAAEIDLKGWKVPFLWRHFWHHTEQSSVHLLIWHIPQE
jgi:hypothetical protein